MEQHPWLPPHSSTQLNTDLPWENRGSSCGTVVNEKGGSTSSKPQKSADKSEERRGEKPVVALCNHSADALHCSPLFHLLFSPPAMPSITPFLYLY